MGTPNSISQPPQTFQNSAEHLVFRSQRTQHCTPLLRKLHWLPVMSELDLQYAVSISKRLLVLPLSTFPNCYKSTHLLAHCGRRLIHVFSPYTATNESKMVYAVSSTMAPTPGMTCHMTSDTVTLSLLLKID